MPRIIVKGGIWKNTEDEILKAAVMKYGKNQWARISSLLHRKSAKQCKARWNEWLDPSIKKTEWSKEEEEKLLHLAKLFPTQWRTIAPMVGRTAGQCLEHYERLISNAQRREGEEAPEDIKKTRPGEIDPTPESRPARPDPIDMDEDEKEMLSEARARLANTEGKKAKRKARERHLEEARRLSNLQKSRELRAAGIVAKAKKKKKGGIDYNAEIPFRKPVAPGFYDVSEEREKEEIARKKFQAKTVKELDGIKQVDGEAERRKKDNAEMKRKREENLPEAFRQITKQNNEPQIKRTKLVLPKPQVSGKEIEEIVKIGASGQVEKNALMEDTRDATSVTRGLIQDYQATPAPSSREGHSFRTPRTPAVNHIQQEAQNLAALTQQQSALHGGENTPLHSSDFRGLTPARTVTATPNMVLRTPAMGPPGARTTDATPFKTPVLPTPSHLAGKTPMRDNLRINKEDEASSVFDQKASKKGILSGLASLPKPKNDFDIVLPELPPEEPSVAAKPTDFVEDAADVNKNYERLLKEEQELKRRMQSKAVQRDLPRPLSVNEDLLKLAKATNLNEMQKADILIQKEIVSLLEHDRNVFPVNGGEPKEGVFLEPFNEDELQAAGSLLEKEIQSLRTEMNVKEFEAQLYDQLWKNADEDVSYVTSQNRYGRTSMISFKERGVALVEKFDKLSTYVKVTQKRSKKMSKKAQILLGGYLSKKKAIANEIDSLEDGIMRKEIELCSYERLKEGELAACPARIEVMQMQVDEQKVREKLLQSRYKDLCDRAKSVGLSV
eukprot:Nk52_evm12s238 gene=Nk52_evmTU12s238